MRERRRGERPIDHATTQGERRSEVVVLHGRPRPVVATSRGSAWYHEAAIDEASKPASPAL